MAAILYACLILILSSTDLTNAASAFCSRAADYKKCPVPATADSVDIGKYIGSWYEIGSTAAFKLLQESGLVCVEARYGLAHPATLNRGANVTVLNSGITVIDSQSSQGVTQISNASQSICYTARQICYSFDNDSRFKLALLHIHSQASSLASYHHKEAAKLIAYAQDIQSFVDLIQFKLEALSSTISKIQTVDGELCQKKGIIQDNLNLVYKLVEKAMTLARAVKDYAKHIASKAEDLSKVSAKLATKRELASSRKIAEASSWIRAESELISANVSEIQLYLDKVLAAEKLITNQTIKDGYFDFKAYAIQNKSSPGKLQLNGVSPYWILALEGNASSGYDSSLVYSCTETEVGLDHGVFVLSRKPTISQVTMDKFMAIIASSGIILDCDNPFIYTVLRGGDCSLKV